MKWRKLGSQFLSLFHDKELCVDNSGFPAENDPEYWSTAEFRTHNPTFVSTEHI